MIRLSVLVFGVCALLSHAASGQELAVQPPTPTLEARFASAKAIESQQWYSDNASLLEDVLWQPDGALVFHDRVNSRYLKLDVARWRWIPLAHFDTLATGSALRDRAEVNRAPRGEAGLILQDGNLYLVSSALPDGLQLTRDGSDLITYGSVARPLPRADEKLLQPRVVWSGDGRYALVSRLDQTKVRESSIMDWMPGGKPGKRPEHFTVRHTYFGDTEPTARALYVVDIAARTMALIPGSAAGEIVDDPVGAGFADFSDDGRKLYYVRGSEDSHTAQLIEVDLRTLASRIVLTERAPDGGFLYFSGGRNPAAFHVFPARNALVWYSERDGFGHLYLHELDSGRLVRQLTRGPWTVVSIVRVVGDEIYFLRTNGEENAEPYHHQLYSLNLDTGRTRQHTDSRKDHVFSWPDRGELFVESSASIDSPNRLVVRGIGRAASRKPLQFGMPPAQALGEIRKTGFRAPTRFHVKSSIGGRTVWGTIYVPSWVAPGHRLPVIEKVYPGYCCVPAPWAFPHQRGGRFTLPRFFEPQALAELGFVVVITAGPGSPLRGRAYHQAQLGEGYWDADSLETHIDVLRQLGEQHPEMDLSRVGIYGHSGGGYAAARAILKYSDFYKVAVALAGNHDRRLYGASWPVMYAGHDPRAPDALDGPETVALAGNLRGHLLLMHGDVDTAVLIDSTLQLAGALQRASKKFDLQMIIGAGHSIDSNPYAQQYYWSYFLEHLRSEKTSVDFTRY